MILKKDKHLKSPARYIYIYIAKLDFCKTKRRHFQCLLTEKPNAFVIYIAAKSRSGLQINRNIPSRDA